MAVSKRRCLSCNKTFAPEGRYNFICPNCQRKNVRKGPRNPHKVCVGKDQAELVRGLDAELVRSLIYGF